MHAVIENNLQKVLKKEGMETDFRCRVSGFSMKAERIRHGVYHNDLTGVRCWVSSVRMKAKRIGYSVMEEWETWAMGRGGE
jgi:alanyl-tRNA synthetase